MKPVNEEIEQMKKEIIDIWINEYNLAERWRTTNDKKLFVIKQKKQDTVKMKDAILDCWELIDPDPTKKKYPHWLYDLDILENQAGLIKQLRDILEPVVEKIMKEGD